MRFPRGKISSWENPEKNTSPGAIPPEGKMTGPAFAGQQFGPAVPGKVIYRGGVLVWTQIRSGKSLDLRGPPSPPGRARQGATGWVACGLGRWVRPEGLACEGLPGTPWEAALWGKANPTVHQLNGRSGGVRWSVRPSFLEEKPKEGPTHGDPIHNGSSKPSRCG